MKCDRCDGDKDVDPQVRCVWQVDNDGVWNTSCGQAHVFIDGTPRQNDYEFCPYCGKALAENHTPTAEVTRMETAEKPIASTEGDGAVSMSPSTFLLDSIMDAVRNTPQKLHEYRCHGDCHSYRAPDYDTILAKIEALLSNNELSVAP